MKTREELAVSLAAMRRKAREDAGWSQDRLARAMGVSKTTIQNWESGFGAPPDVRAFEMFSVMGVSPLPYYVEVFYPDADKKEFSKLENLKQTAHELLDALPAHYLEIAIELMSGACGGSPFALMDMMCAHMQTPLNFRAGMVNQEIVNYEIAEAQGTISRPDLVQPDLEVLRGAAGLGKKAAIEGQSQYTAING